jgi:hypothetical protein
MIDCTSTLSPMMVASGTHYAEGIRGDASVMLKRQQGNGVFLVKWCVTSTALMFVESQLSPKPGRQVDNLTCKRCVPNQGDYGFADIKSSHRSGRRTPCRFTQTPHS